MNVSRFAAAAALVMLLGGTAAAQTTLRIGLAEDPDVLDPTFARTYVGRIVFAAFCDKLFDIDDKLNVVPQLGLSHETSPDGKTVTIKLRPNVKFHDGEVFDAEAAKYSLERHLTMQGSFRRPELAAIDHIEVADPLTIRIVLKNPFAPLIAQLTDRAGMMVSPKAAKEAGDKFSLKPVCAGPYKFVERVQQDRMVFEKFQDYWNKDNIHIDRVVFLPIVDATVRLANLRSGGLDLIERLLATDIKDVRADSRLKLATVIELGYQGLDLNIANGTGAKGPIAQSAKVRQALDLAIDREALNQVVFNGEVLPGNQWVSPEHPYYQKSFPVRKRDVEKAKALMKEVGVTTPFDVDFMVPKGAENSGRRRGDPGDGGRDRHHHENPCHRVRDLAQAGRAGRVPGLSAGMVGPHRPRRQRLHLPQMQGAAEQLGLLQSRRRQAARRVAHSLRHGGAQGDLREDHQDRAR